MEELYRYHTLQQKTFNAVGEILFKNELLTLTRRQQQH
jgi:hypothetical protein